MTQCVSLCLGVCVNEGEYIYITHNMCVSEGVCVCVFVCLCM